MALMPKRVKHRKSQRGRIRGDASRGNRVVFGDYGFAEAMIAQGHIGIQVWINLGTYSEEDINGANAKTSEAPKKPKRTYKR